MKKIRYKTYEGTPEQWSFKVGEKVRFGGNYKPLWTINKINKKLKTFVLKLEIEEVEE